MGLRNLRLAHGVWFGVAALALLGGVLWMRSAGDVASSRRGASRTPSPVHSTWVWHYDPRAGDANLPTYRDLMHALPEDGRVLVAVPSQRDAIAFSSKLGAQWAGDDRITYVNARTSLSGWARDHYIAFETHGARHLLCPAAQSIRRDSRGDACVPGELSRQDPGLHVVKVGYGVEGGDLILTGDRVLIGGATVANYAGGNPKGEEALLRQLEQVFGRRPLIVRGADGRVPCPHIDMILGVVDDRTIVLGDPRLGIDPWPDTNGEIVDLATFGALGTFSRAHQLSYAETYDEIALLLRAEGFTVHRVPALHGRVLRMLHGGGGREYDGTPPVLSWTNVLLDTRRGRETVWLPCYGMTHLDARAQQVWEDLGFEVRAVDARGAIRLGGGLRCTTNVVPLIDMHCDEPPFLTHPSDRQ